MDPNHWANYNPSYSRLASAGHPTSHTGINRLDFPILDQATITSGLGLSAASLTGHSGLTSRSIPGLPTVNYHGHSLHNSVSQFLDPINSLQAANFPGQSPYKPISSSSGAFAMDSASRSVSELSVGYSGSRYSVSTPTTSAGLTSPTKSTYFPSEKEQIATYAASQAAQAAVEANLKGWGLSNFVPFTDLSPPFTSSMQPSQPAPPPAHSTGSSGRMSSSSRIPFSQEDIFSPRSSKTMVSSHSQLPVSPYLPASSQRSRSQTMSSYSSSPPEIEDLSSHSQSQLYSTYSNLTSTAYTTIASNNPVYSSQLHADMNYDPVSPVTPVSHSPPSQTTDPFNTVSLHDLENIGTVAAQIEKSRNSSRKDLLVNDPAIEKLNKRMAKESSNLMHQLSSRTDRPVVNSPLPNMGSMPIMQQKTSHINNGKSNPSPMQQSPISVGSPQAPMTLNSPQTSSIPSTTSTPAPNPTIQAVPDSTTKPKSRKPRKKRIDSNLTYIPSGTQHQFTPTMNQPSNRNHPSEITLPLPYRNPLHQPYNPSAGGRSGGTETPLSPLHRPMPTNILGSPLSEDMTSIHRMPSISDDLLSRQSSISSLAENNQGSIHSSPGTDHLQNITSHSVHHQVSPLVNTSPQTHMPVNHMMEPGLISRQVHDSGHRSFRENVPGSMLSNVFSDSEITANQSQFDMNGYSVSGVGANTFLEELNSQAAPNMETFTGEMLVDRESFHTTMLDISGYSGGHYGAPPGLGQPDMNNPMHLSTIDESTFTSMLDQDMSRRYRAQEPKLTCTVPVEIDDELAIFSQPPMPLQTVNQISPKPQKVAPPQNAFNDSFINFVKGKKPETLSTVNSGPHKKPQLPKYIPEPQRRIVKKPEPKLTPVTFSSDDDDDGDSEQNVSDVIDDLLSDSDSNSNISAEYTVKKQNKSNKKIPPLVIKKKHIQPPLKVSKAKVKVAKPKKRNFTKEYSVVVDPYAQMEVEQAAPRTLISRRAKEKALEKSATKKKDSNDDVSGEESEPEYEPRTKKSRGLPSLDYDSDDDPAWTPFELDVRQQAEEEGEFKPRRNRNRQRSSGGSTRQRHRSQSSHCKTVDSLSSDSFQDDPTVTPTASTSSAVSKTITKSPSTVKFGKPNSRVPDEKTEISKAESEEESFQVGRFLIEKKDLNNYETYPIWRIEQGGMIHKYEIFPEEGNIRHISVSTYSSWMPIMKDQFIPIRVKVLTEKNNKSVVEVLEEFKPKPPSDGSLETMYEEDPLVDLFNVYLQIFLSQALEPSFLKAIKDSQEHFYLVPLDKVDKLIDRKLEEIDQTVKWRPYFKECLKSRPSIKERDRPNLKQSCQACENSSPPTVKSLHLLGQPYDRFLLKTITDISETAMVFMIGKTAAQYVGHYHNLYHFKYMLYQRCLAKIRIIREGEPNISNEHILDQCLQNRAWVLKIFEDLKELLEKG